MPPPSGSRGMLLVVFIDGVLHAERLCRSDIVLAQSIAEDTHFEFAGKAGVCLAS